MSLAGFAGGGEAPAVGQCMRTVAIGAWVDVTGILAVVPVVPVVHEMR